MTAAPQSFGDEMQPPLSYVLRYLLWLVPSRLVRVWWEADKFPTDCLRLVDEAYRAGIPPRRRLYPTPPWWRTKLRVIEGGR